MCKVVSHSKVHGAELSWRRGEISLSPCQSAQLLTASMLDSILYSRYILLIYLMVHVWNWSNAFITLGTGKFLIRVPFRVPFRVPYISWTSDPRSNMVGVKLFSIYMIYLMVHIWNWSNACIRLGTGKFLVRVPFRVPYISLTSDHRSNIIEVKVFSIYMIYLMVHEWNLNLV